MGKRELRKVGACSRYPLGTLAGGVWWGFMMKRQEIELERRGRKEVLGDKVRGKMKRDRKGEGEKMSKKGGAQMERERSRLTCEHRDR